MELKSEIARPRVYETLVPNRTYTVSGAAWAGETDVTEIAVSTDGGQTWVKAEFLRFAKAKGSSPLIAMSAKPRQARQYCQSTRVGKR
jgi:hypothetical protein